MVLLTESLRSVALQLNVTFSPVKLVTTLGPLIVTTIYKKYDRYSTNHYGINAEKYVLCSPVTLISHQMLSRVCTLDNNQSSCIALYASA